MIFSPVGYYIKPFNKLSTSIQLCVILQRIKDGFYSQVINKCRFLYEAKLFEEYTLFKKNLPAVTFSGTFSPSRNVENLVTYTHFIIFDLDDLSAFQLFDIRKKLEFDPYVFSLWLSPSGNGLKFLISTEHDSSKHKEVYNSALKYFTETYQLKIDKSGSDLSRLCFISYDPDLFMNLNALLYNGLLGMEKIGKQEHFEIIEISTPATFQTIFNGELNKDKESFRKLYHYLNKRNFSITETYEKWVKVAFALRNTFPYNLGRKYFLELCRLDLEKHDELASKKLINSCYKYGGSKSNFGTLFFLAKEKGYIQNFDSSQKCTNN